jgi:hypothetical protein
MCVSSGITCTSWVTFAGSAALVTSGDGTRSANVWLEDAWGNRTSNPVSDTIGVDATAPKNGTMAVVAGTGGAAASWSGFSDVTSGIASYTLVYQTGTSPTTKCASGTTAWSGTDLAATLSGLTSGTKYFFRLCAKDVAGNVSTGATATYTP